MEYIELLEANSAAARNVEEDVIEITPEYAANFRASRATAKTQRATGVHLLKKVRPQKYKGKEQDLREELATLRKKVNKANEEKADKQEQVKI